MGERTLPGAVTALTELSHHARVAELPESPSALEKNRTTGSSWST
jgi:hypothetical protein